MEYRILGRSGIKVSPLVLGTDNFGNPTSLDESAEIIRAAVHSGINLIDTSNSYSQGESEKIIGRTLKEMGSRDNVLIATKVHYPTGPGPNQRGNSKLHIIRACEDSLRRLQTDYIDLYQIHRPDFNIPQEETLAALDTLVKQGKVIYIGSSTAPAWKIMEGLMISEIKGLSRFVSEQPPYNLLDRRIENELVPMCQAHGIGLLTWSPLAMGMLAGRYKNLTELPADSRAKLRGGIYANRLNSEGIEAGAHFVALAAKFGLSAAQTALTWVKDQPGITAPIIGPKSIEQLNLLLPVMEMSFPEELKPFCDSINKPGKAIADFHNTAGW